MKNSRLIIALVLLGLMVGLLFALPGARMPLASYSGGSHYFRGMPTSYWHQQAIAHARLRREQSARPWRGMKIYDGPFVPSSVQPDLPQPDLRLFEGDPSATPVLIDLLRHWDLDVRHSACEGLAKVGPAAAPAMPDLIEALTEKGAFLQEPAAYALGEIGTAAIIPLLHKHSPREEGEYAIFVALGSIGPDAAPAIPVLLDALKDRDRNHASRALARIGSRAVPALLEALESSDWEARWQATLALSETRADPDTLVPVLIKLLHDEDGVVRQAAAGGLGRLGSAAHRGVPALIEALKDREGYARREAIDALGWIGASAQAAVPALAQMLANERDDYMRQCIYHALKNIKEPKGSKVD